jgi:hypothetical protein
MLLRHGSQNLGKKQNVPFVVYLDIGRTIAFRKKHSHPGKRFVVAHLFVQFFLLILEIFI